MSLNIVLATGGLPFTGDSLEKGSLGGSETAFIQMAKALAARGHRVHAFCNCSRPMLSDGVYFHDAEDIRQHLASVNYDVMISSRWPEFLHVPSNAGLRIFWGHDTLVERSRFMSGFILSDLCVLLSDFHIRNYEEQIPEMRKFTWQSRNGIDLKLIQANRAKKVPGKIIYTSRPERGLHYLLGDIFPRLLAEHPNLKLHYANYDLKGLQVPRHVQAAIDASSALAKNYPRNVVPLGHLTKAQLYQEISSAQLLLYPTDFPEISCITALEAMACGTPIVSTKDFALSETVEDQVGGWLIEGKPTDEEYINEFVAVTNATLRSEETLARMSTNAIESVVRRGYTWDKIAEEWEAKFNEMLQKRWNDNQKKVIQELVRHEDLVLAKIIARKANKPDLVTEIGEKITHLHQNPPRPKSTEEVKQLFASRKAVYGDSVKLIHGLGLEPKSFLDWECGFAPFGIVLSKHAPGLPIVFEEYEGQACENLAEIASKMEMQNFTIRNNHGQDKFDLVFIGDALERALDPQGLLEKVCSRVTDDGYLMFTTTQGPSAQTLRGLPEPSRLWNFMYSDFVDMFGEDADFKGTFVQESHPDTQEVRGHWIIITRPKSKFGKINVNRKQLATHPYQTVAACLISRNEEENIIGALKSLHGIVDKIIVADNSTRDDLTPQIAERNGAEVHRIIFDNFAQARNESVSFANTDWILWLDADERLTEPHKLRKYLTGSVFEGFGIEQVHLTIDSMNKSSDIPTRLYRRRDHYKFVGLVHEQIQDISVNPYDDPLTPTLLIPDVHLAHFGYIYESKRRHKASSRNLTLLLREAQEHPKRMLTKVLLIRDCLNFIRWRAELVKDLKVGSFEHQICEAALSIYFRYFSSANAKYLALAEPMIQEFLLCMGRSGVPYGGRKNPPFEAMCGYARAVAGFSEEDRRSLTPKSFWVVDEHHFVNQAARDINDLLSKFTKANPELDDLTLANTPQPTLTDEQVVQTLSAAIGMF